MIDEYLNRMEEEASTTGSLAEAAVEKSLAELDLAANPVNPGLTQPGLKMAPRPGPMVGGMGEVRGDLRFGILRLSTIKSCPHMLRSDHRELRNS